MQYKSFVITVLTQLMLITLLGACSSSEEQQANYLNRAQEQYDADDSKKARLELRNVLQINPYNPQARYLLALIHAQDANWREVSKNLSLAIEYAPDFIDPRIKMGGLLFRYGPSADEKTLEQADAVLALDPDNADARALRAVVFQRQGEEADAISEAQLALDSVPGHVGASSVMVKVYTDQDAELALAYIDTSIEINPSDSVAKEVKLALLNRQDETAAAIALYNELIADDPENIVYYVRLLAYLSEKDRDDEADALLSSLAISPRDSIDFKIWLAQALNRKNLLDIAENTVKGFIIDYPEEYELRFALSRIYMTSDRTASNNVLREIIALDVDGADAQSARGAIAAFAWMLDNDRATAEAMANEMLVIEEGNHHALQLRAIFRLLDNNNIGAISDLRAVLKSNPTSVASLLMLGEAHTANNSMDLALDAYRSALELSPNDGTGVQKISQLLINQGNYTAAESILISHLEQFPANADAHVLLIESYILQQRWNDALTVTRELEKQDQQLARGVYLRGRVLYASKEYPAAITAFEEVLQLEPSAVEALSYLVNTMLVTGEVSGAEAYLLKHIEAYPQQVHPLELQGSVYLSSGDFDAAIESYRAALLIDPQRGSAQVALGRALQAKGDLLAALKAYDDGLQLWPKNVDLLTLKAGLLEALKRHQDAVDGYNAVLAINEDEVIASNNLAMLLIDYFPSEESFARAFQLTSKFEDTNIAVLLDTRGWLYYHMEDYVSAKRVLKRAVAADGDESIFRFHLGMAYYRLGDNTSAKIELEKSLANDAKFVGSDEASELVKKL
ncbi:tetratricopeptide repeat protein [Halioglobus sp. Uisw_031]|uniref:tetratricopeptide repeat protein n=1 Tax=Halioglobus sp. Uisw_031 TaxID=3230977 RepID=UPI0039E884C1